MSRRSARRSTRQTTERPVLDHDVLISLLELDPDFEALLRGEAPPGAAQFTASQQVEPAALEQAYTIEQVEIVVTPAFEPAPAYEPVQEARIIDVEQVRVEKVTAVRPSAPRRRTRQPKQPSRTRADRRRQKLTPAPEPEQLAAIHELYHEAPPAGRVAAIEQVERPAPDAEQVAATELVVREAPAAEQVAVRELVVREAPAAEQVAAMAPSLERTIEKARAEIALRNLPIKIPNFAATMLAAQQAGWSIPPARRLQWDYMNFQMPPVSDVVLTPRQAKRKEWRTMIKYYRIHPYKSHYRQDQKEARRMISQAKRTRLNLA